MLERYKVNREKFLAVIAAVVIAAVVALSAVINPQLERRKARLEQLRQLQLKLAKMKSDLLVKDRIEKIYSKVEPLIASTGPNQQEISLFTRELSDLYSNLKVKIRSVKILPVTEEKFYRRLSIKVEMTGHIKSILRFIFSVETYQNPIRIEKLDLQAREIIDNVQASFLVTKIVAQPQN